jgi:hypothetical protein
MVGLSLLWSSSARALEAHDRAGWYLGLGFGPARGAVFVAGEPGGELWETGSSPQIRLGKMLGRRFALGLEAQTWFVEGGTAGEDLPIQLKLRLTGHLWALAGTWFPGRPDSFWGGFYARAGAGPAIANYAVAIPDPDDPESGQELQERVDEWGWGLVVALGYELRVTRHFAAGLQVSSNYLWIHEEVDRMWYGGPVLQLNWYF